jgi:hypothetical protein
MKVLKHETLGVEAIPKEHVPGSEGILIQISIKQANAIELGDERVQKKYARKLFDWMFRSLPHGIYKELVKLILIQEVKLGNIE